MTLVVAAFLAGISWNVSLLYLAGAVILIIGLSTTIKGEVSPQRGIDKIIAFGPLFLAAPMAVFGTEHFTFADSVATIVPAWIPWHLFLVFLVGTCLIASALSLAARKYAGLAAALFGVMLLLFECLIHIPNIAGQPRNRILWAVALRDLTFSTGALALGLSQISAQRTGANPSTSSGQVLGHQRLYPTQPKKGWVGHPVVTVARFVIGIAFVFFAVEHFLHPEFAPGVPLGTLTPPWFPEGLLLSYVTGAVFLVTGICLIFDKEARMAAAWLGLWILLLTLVLYVPMTIAQPFVIGNGLNPLADTLLLSGAVLCFAGAQGRRLTTQAGIPG
jgi:uncharacterized membrane protein